MLCCLPVFCFFSHIHIQLLNKFSFFLSCLFVSQIDGSTLRTLCMQHGPLITFHLNLPHGNAVVCYSSKDEAAKAQKSLHM